MNLETFLAHYQLQQNPFGAEEARHDPVFEQLADTTPTHPDFPKVLGRLDKPSTAIVFGEKGSGKTAFRLLIGREVAHHNQQHPDRRTLIVAYDDLNPVLDKLLRTHKQNADVVLRNFRLEDHQDAILSLAVTRLVDSILGKPDGDEPVPLPPELDKTLRKMRRETRVDLAVLAALYDQPRTGHVADRWRQLRSKLRLGWRWPLVATRNGATALTIIAIGLGIALWLVDPAPDWLAPVLGFFAAAAILSWGYWAWRHTRLWLLARRIRRDMPTVQRSKGELRQLLAELPAKDLARQPFPGNDHQADKKSTGDARYQLTRRLVDVLNGLGYVGMIVLVDRVDEPTLVSGNAERMKAIIWPMFDNKFFQQTGVGLKLLLPLELRHMLHRESPAFFQEARLDKQNLIDRLTWSGATLYDLCSSRLRACRPAEAEPLAMTDLFEESVSRDLIIDALDQMHQPRDAFKFLYSVIQEHCRLVPEEQANYKIARLTLESVRRDQAQRVQELHRGLSPA